MTEFHFWADVMLRQPRVWASRASPDQKWQGLKVVYSKNFSRATFFVFWSDLILISYLSYLPVKQIWRKNAVWYCGMLSSISMTIQNLNDTNVHQLPVCIWKCYISNKENLLFKTGLSHSKSLYRSHAGRHFYGTEN